MFLSLNGKADFLKDFFCKFSSTCVYQIYFLPSQEEKASARLNNTFLQTMLHHGNSSDNFLSLFLWKTAQSSLQQVNLFFFWRKLRFKVRSVKFLLREGCNWLGGTLAKALGM